jgi:aryl-alcohol dehydrogenase-like predicted oxidoreductase
MTNIAVLPNGGGPDILLPDGGDSASVRRHGGVAEGKTMTAKLDEYHLLGRSGLRVSTFALGTMTFGMEWKWGSPEETARPIFRKYMEAGGNFVDTADVYTNGTSEEMVGRFVQEAKARDQMVIATKYSFGAQPGNPNAGGNSRKNLMRAVNGSLQRLKTDYIDLYWVHAWDGLTPIEEVISSLDDLVRSGKVRYIGLSNCPAWYASEANTIARLRGYEPIVAMQMEYNLTERSIEREHVPLALHQGMGICAWSPLAAGLLTGRHSRQQLGPGRLQMTQNSGNPIMEKFAATPRNWDILDTLVVVAREGGRTPARVALNWITKRPGITSVILGATKLSQFEDNLDSLSFELSPEHWARLEQVSRPETGTPHTFSSPPIRAMLAGGAKVKAEPAWFRQ